MKLALCSIVKDNSEFDSWVRMIESALPVVDEVVVTANGKEVDKIESYCKEKGFNYSYLPWNKNFSEQRNFNFSQVSSNTDYILWMDADDILVGSEHLRHVLEVCKRKGWHSLFLEYWYGCLFDGEPSYENLIDVELHHPRERIIKPGTITWKKRIHETPVPKEGLDYKYSRILHTPEKPDAQYPIAIMHTGADRFISKEALERRMERNTEILELELEDERKANNPDPRTILYLLKIYAEEDKQDQWVKGMDLGQEYLTMSGWDLERGECLSLMAVIAGKQGVDRKSKDLLHQAIEEYPFNPMLYLMLSESYYNLGLYDRMEFYLKQALTMDVQKGQGQKNILQLKLLSTQLLLKLEFQVNKNVDKSLQLAKTLYEIDPSPETKGTVDYLTDLKETNDACRNVDELSQYLVSLGEKQAVFDLVQSLPLKIKQYPFATKLMNKYGKPKKWASNEICYFANFGQTHVEQWSPKNLEQGLGGSETAVIRLAREWVKMGYKVTVYGDPGKEEGDHNGVTYLPYYKFNPRDHFNIFIQWRNNSLAGKIVCKLFLVDLHDVWSEEAYDNIHSIDRIMVKSKAHRNLSQKIPSSKFKVVSNGI